MLKSVALAAFEQCDGGTIFLDEVGDMSPITQGKVLRLLQEQKFERVGGNELITTDVRIIAATNRPLEEMVRKNLFREDLLYRLNGITINLPPLRDRREDVPPLLQYFLRRAKSEMKRSELTGISPEALQLLVNYDWPGNVRQLQSVVRQSLLHTTGTVIGPTNLPDFVRNHSGSSLKVASNATLPLPSAFEDPIAEYRESNENASVRITPSIGAFENSQSESIQSEVSESQLGDSFALESFVAERLKAGSTQLYDEVLGEVERRLFTRVLAATGGNQSKTAEILGITRGKVRDRIAHFWNLHGPHNLCRSRLTIQHNLTIE